ncbi:MAG: hypothetical protein AUH05_23225 [Ktedonobacter sp. 13_2_20CM_53_11]|nr:MAG: hypothetical protein AUH05_23225 [Ktedonobacter sp. 13_2_20CM_53_11]
MGRPMERSFWFGSAKSFKESFPELHEALIEYYETGEGVDARLYSGPKKYTKPLQVNEPLMRCSNPRCERGGYEIDREIRNIMLGQKTKAEFVLYCPGDEGTPKGRKKGDNCDNALHVRLTIKYKKEPAGLARVDAGV